MSSRNRPIREVATFALAATVEDSISDVNYQKTREELNTGLTKWTLGTWSQKCRDQFVKGKSQDRVLQSLKKLLNAMMKALYTLSFGPVDVYGQKRVDVKDVDKWMKEIQTLAKECGAKRFDAEMPVERLRSFMNREMGEDDMFIDSEMDDNMLNMSSQT